jgi:hypothetical protein
MTEVAEFQVVTHVRAVKPQFVEAWADRTQFIC